MLQFLVSGKIGSDAVVNSGKNLQFLNFSVCHNERRKKGAEWVDVPVWFQISKVYDNEVPAEFVKHLKKGQGVIVTGIPKPEHYSDNDGVIRNKIVVEAHKIELI